MPNTQHLILQTGAAAAIVLLCGCMAPQLPPAGPAPGEVEVGHGTQPAEATTGAISTIDEDQTDANGHLSVEELLRGRVAGLQVINTQAGVQYRVRGQNSLLSDQDPLFVIDGVPTSVAHLRGALGGLVAEDIRQIDVLKDVASTSIYGIRGAGGVIIITTRR